MKRFSAIVTAIMIVGGVMAQAPASKPATASPQTTTVNRPSFFKKGATTNPAKHGRTHNTSGLLLQLSIDPMVGVNTGTNIFKLNDMGRSAGAHAALYANLHYPIGRQSNVTVGLGYRIGYTQFANSVQSGQNGLIPYPNANWLRHYAEAATGSIQLPVMINSHGPRRRGISFGFNMGFNVTSKFANVRIDAAGGRIRNTVRNPELFRTFRCDVVLGLNRRMGVFTPGWYLTYNLMPTYIDGMRKAHEFGISIAL